MTVCSQRYILIEGTCVKQRTLHAQKRPGVPFVYIGGINKASIVDVSFHIRFRPGNVAAMTSYTGMTQCLFQVQDSQTQKLPVPLMLCDLPGDTSPKTGSRINLGIVSCWMKVYHLNLNKCDVRWKKTQAKRGLGMLQGMVQFGATWGHYLLCDLHTAKAMMS